jgi:hypothetical protein
MRTFIPAILICLSLTAAAPAPAAFAQGRTRRTTTPPANNAPASSAQTPTCKISQLSLPGADVGAKINACDAALGADGSKGVIHADTPGAITTYVFLSRNRTLWFHNGTYVMHQAYTGDPAKDIQMELGMIRYRDDSTIKGDGWGTIIVEPPVTNRPTVFAPYVSSVLTNGGHFHGVTRNVTIRDLQIKGQQTAASNGTYSTIEIGNSHHVLVENVFLNQTTGNGITAGGSSTVSSLDGCGRGRVETECAQDVVMRGNRLFQVQNQGLNVVNGREVSIVNNVIKDHNRISGSNGVGIDIETNTPTDHAQAIRIADNVLDFTNSPQVFAGNGIAVQSSGQADYGPVDITGNKLIGNTLTEGAVGHMVFGIFVGAGTRKVTIANNTIQRTANSGITLYGKEHVVRDNQLTSVGDGGNLAITLYGTTDSIISGNRIRIDPTRLNMSDVIGEMPNSGANRNTLVGNVTNTMPRLVGAASKVSGHRSWAGAQGRP